MAESSDKTKAPEPSQLWQLPLLITSVVMLVVGMMMAAPEKEENDYQGVLDDAKVHLANSKYDEALDELDKVFQHFDKAPEEIRDKYHLLRGDVLFHKLRSKQFDTPENQQLVLKQYEPLFKKKPELFDVEHLERLALTYLALDSREHALEVLNQIKKDNPGVRQRVLKKMVSAEVEAAKKVDGDPQDAYKMLAHFRREPMLSRENQIWIVKNEADLLAYSGKSKEVIDLLLLRIAQLQSGGVKDLGELRVQLGNAYVKENQLGTAEKSFKLARQSLEPRDPMQAKALVGLGDIKMAEGNVADAKGYYEMVVIDFPESEGYIEALIGRAEASSRLGLTNDALVDYAKVGEILEKRPWMDSRVHESLVQSIATEAERRHDLGQYDAALQFFDMIRRVNKDQLPSALLLPQAQAHENKARQILNYPKGDWLGYEGWSELSPALRAEALAHLNEAADYYYKHGEYIAPQDNEAFVAAMWNAGDIYDFAGEFQKAADIFAQFVQEASKDPRSLTATFRLAEALRAQGDIDAAIGHYKKLIDEHPKSPQAYQSLIPLAQSYMRKGVEQSAEAENLLLSIINDHPAFRPESMEYRQALKELGRLYYRRGGQGEYEKAIARLEEVVARYGDDEEMPELQFMLADAYRKSVDYIDETLKEPLAVDKRNELLDERIRRLDQAREGYDQVIALYEDVDEKELGELEKLSLRNSYFYRADCMYAQKRYEGPEGAIDLYSRAVQRYEKDPAVLVGLIQIVNAYSELGQYDKARAANERAKWHLEQIPESAFNDPNLPMKRESWQQWLDWTSQVALSDNTVNTANPGNAATDANP